MKKKLLVTLITSVFAFSLIGCGASQEAPKEETKVETVVEAEAPSEDTAVVEEKTEEAAVEEVVEEAVEEPEAAVETEEVEEAIEEEAEEAPVESILTKYGLEITHIDGACYEGTFIMGEFNKDENEKVIIDGYDFFEAPLCACMSEIDNGDGTKTIEGYVEVVYSDWSTDFYYNHYDIFMVDLTNGSVISTEKGVAIYNGEEYATHGEMKNEYNKDYTFGTIRLTAVVPSDYDNYAFFIRDCEMRDHLVSSLDQLDNVSGDNHYVLLQN